MDFPILKDEFEFIEIQGFVKPDEIDNIPENPGVYLMRDSSGNVIYVGKAKNLKKRVQSYFKNKNQDNINYKTKLLVDNIHIIDYITVTNEVESLILESNLIKRYNPKYNVVLKDNKFYPLIKVTINEKFPRILFTREQKRDNSLYFGPYPSAHSVRLYIDTVQKIFKLRTCKELPKKECLNYHIGRCTAPCIGKVAQEEYKEQVNQAIKFLNREYKLLIEDLEKQMKEAAKQLLFEKAQIIKEKIQNLKIFEESQNVYLLNNASIDVLAYAYKMNKYLFVISNIRNGIMTGKRSYSVTLQVEENLEDIIMNFIINYWNISDKLADFIIIENNDNLNLDIINNYFSKLNEKVKVRFSENDKELSILKITKENATLHLSQILSKVDSSESLQMLKEVLNLDNIPMHIEGFDIANILGQFAVASLVYFYGGKPDKKNYRHFKIKTKSTPDDFAMIKEVVFRRYKRLLQENQKLPDLILIDGGKGQLNSALEALKELNISLSVVALAKKNEEIYVTDREEPIILPKNSPALHILQNVRDETHRFANDFFRKIYTKSVINSIIDNIPGIGEKRKKLLIKHFYNYDKLKELSVDSLVGIGIPKNLAENIIIKLKYYEEK